MKTAIFVLVMVLSAASAHSQTVEDTFSTQKESPFSALGGSLSFGFANLSQSGEFNLSGPSVGFGLAGKIHLDDADPFFLEWSGSVAWGSDYSSSTEIQGSDTLLYTSRRSPVGTADLTTIFNVNGSAAEAFVQITDSMGDTATIYSSANSPNAPGTSISQYAASFTDAGGIFAALTTNGEDGTATSYGGLFDDTGVSFMGTGDESDTTVTTTVENNVRLSNHVLFLSNRIALDNDWTLSPKIGPTYRKFDRSQTRRTAIDIDEGFNAASSIPTFSVDDNWSLSGRYYGAVLGAGLTRKIYDNWSVNLGAEAGLASYKAKSETLETVNLAGSSSLIPGVSNSLNGTAQIGRITGGFTHITRNGAIINFGGYWDYMSDVPYLQFETVSSPNVTSSGSTVGLTGNGETYRTHSIQKKKMISTGLNLNIVFLF